MENIDRRLNETNVPLCYGMFVAGHPDYRSLGIGNFLYKRSTELIKDFCMKKQMNQISLRRQQIASEKLPNGKNDPSLSPTNGSKVYKKALPLFVTTSHNERSANFHVVNGYQQVTKIPYFDDDTGGKGNQKLYVHVLAFDPFKTGRINKAKDLFPPHSSI